MLVRAGADLRAKRQAVASPSIGEGPALRATRMLRSPTWSPTFGGFREPTRMGETRLAQ